MLELAAVLFVLGLSFIIQSWSGKRLIRRFGLETIRGMIDLPKSERLDPITLRNKRMVRQSVLYHERFRTAGIVCCALAFLFVLYLLVA
jgi:hypothetical protein